MTRIKGDLKDRSFRFAQSILKAVDYLPDGSKGWEIGKQLIRAGTSIGANIREADNALTVSDFAYKCSLARKEASESQYWLELCLTTGLLTHEQGSELTKEAEELAKILSVVVRGTQSYIDAKR
jgi:four helix bundle protein